MVAWDQGSQAFKEASSEFALHFGVLLNVMPAAEGLEILDLGIEPVIAVEDVMRLD